MTDVPTSPQLAEVLADVAAAENYRDTRLAGWTAAYSIARAALASGPLSKDVVDTLTNEVEILYGRLTDAQAELGVAYTELNRVLVKEFELHAEQTAQAELEIAQGIGR